MKRHESKRREHVEKVGSEPADGKGHLVGGLTRNDANDTIRGQPVERPSLVGCLVFRVPREAGTITMELDAYLDRIRYRGRREPTLDTLVRLHRAHMFTVPFENLDIPLKRPITLCLPEIFDKIVTAGRGGFCYELNGLFAWLLEQLGFPVELLSAKVFEGEQPGPDFDHMLLHVPLETTMIADVGFGDSFVEPLPLEGEREVEQGGRLYRVGEAGPEHVLERKEPGSDWRARFQFALTPRRFSDFAAMCDYQQTSPRSSFTRKTVCSLARPDGRITLSNGRLITTTRDGRTERHIASAEEYGELLSTVFGVNLDQPAVQRLMTLGGPGQA